MTEDRSESHQNEPNNARLAPAEKINDSITMYPAQIPRLDHIDRSLDDLMRRSIPKWVLKPFIVIALGYPMWRMVRGVESIANQQEYLWKILLREMRKETGIVRGDSEIRNIARDLGEAGDEAIRSVNTDPFEPYFPRFTKRMRAAIDQLKTMQSTYRNCILFEGNDDMMREADRQYAEGTLMDIETFANGLQGH